jgi:chemotaxis protein CheZ
MRANMTESEALRAALAPSLDDLRRFIDRRFAELSTEIHATVQMVDFSEANLTTQLEAMKEQLASVLALPAANSRNSGAELEAVVQTTEAAANRIMEAAEAIGEWLVELRADPALRERITDKVNAIFEACSFQDLTSQRIRRAIDHLHQVEVMLGNIGPSTASHPAMTLASPDLAQAEIDRMLSE